MELHFYRLQNDNLGDDTACAQRFDGLFPGWAVEVDHSLTPHWVVGFPEYIHTVDGLLYISEGRQRHALLQPQEHTDLGCGVVWCGVVFCGD